MLYRGFIVIKISLDVGTVSLISSTFPEYLKLKRSRERN